MFNVKLFFDIKINNTYEYVCYNNLAVSKIPELKLFRHYPRGSYC